jgi:histone arginine demethylase JMJD6
MMPDGASRAQDTVKFNMERRPNLSYQEFSEGYLYPNKPVIITGAMDQWNALKRWTPEFFKTEFRSMKFSIGDTEYGQAAHGESAGTEFTMAEFIDRVLQSCEESPAPYFRNRNLYALFPSLKEDIEPLPEYLLPNWLGDKYLVKQVGEVLNRGAVIEIYIGGKGGRFPVLHYDGVGTHAFLMQIHGQKQYIVYPPEQERFLYASPRKINLSLINDVDKPDLEKYPLFAKATPTVFVLEPGELLFVPSHWWHTAKMLTPSITISANVLNQSNWNELIEYAARRRRNPVLSLASRWYLTGAGAWRSWRDRDWRDSSTPRGAA